MVSRPRLKPHLTVLRRSEDAVQFGVDPGPDALILRQLATAEIELLIGLDGTRTTTELAAALRRSGGDPARLPQLLGILHDHRLLVPGTVDRAHLQQVSAPVRSELSVDAHAVGMTYRDDRDGFHHIADRARLAVLVDGAGPLAVALAQLLRTCGIGSVTVGPAGAEQAEHDLVSIPVRSPAAGSGSGAAGSVPAVGSPDLVVLIGSRLVHPARSTGWLRHEVAHLPIAVEPHRVVVGPLMGVSPQQPCLLCQHLYRGDRDRAWPQLAAQLFPSDLTSSGAPVAETTLTQLAVGAAAMIAVAHLDGQPTPCGVAVELSLPWPVPIYRRWHRHPDCPDHGRLGGAPEADRGPGSAPRARRPPVSAAQATMAP